jgi:uncharacterized membrane protein
MASATSTVTKAKSAAGYEGAGPVGLVALVRHGLDEFLAFPLVVVAAFIALATLTLWMDNSRLASLIAGREMLARFVFVRESGTASMLGQLLGGLLTVISITFSALLLAVQQTAVTLSSQVYSQFLRRRINQLYFGFFLGLAVYDIAALAAAHPDFNPVYTASLAVLMTTAGLCLLLVLIYSTVDQMRPSVIVHSLRDHTLGARARSTEALARTRRESRSPAPMQATVLADDDGFLQEIRLERLVGLLGKLGPDAELEVLQPIGSFIAFEDPLVVIRARAPQAAELIKSAARCALVLRPERDLKRDAAFGIAQMESIGWTTASSAKSTPDAPRLVIHALRDLLARWIAEERGQEPAAADRVVAIVIPDRMHRDALDALVTVGLGSGHSRQHVVVAVALDALGQLLPRTTHALRDRLLDGIRTMIPALSDVALTTTLREALARLAEELARAGESKLARELESTAAALAARNGRLRPAGERAPLR